MKILLFPALLAAVTLALPSCSEECPASRQRINYLDLYIDYSDELNYKKFQSAYEEDLKQMFRQMFRLEDCACTGGRVKIISVGASGNLEVKTFAFRPLPATPDKNRIPKDYLTFVQQVKAAMKKSAESAGEELSQTYFYEPLCREMNALVMDERAGKKMVVIYGDMLEHSDVLNMYKFNFGSGNAYSILSKGFACDLPDLSGVEIYNVNHRSADTEKRIRKAAHFWEKVFKERNVDKAIFRSSLHFEDQTSQK